MLSHLVGFALINLSSLSLYKTAQNFFSRQNLLYLSYFLATHVDLWGPYPHSNYNGYKYFLTVVDDYSCVTWTHLLAAKSIAFPILKSFIAFVYTQFLTTVKSIRFDNGMDRAVNRSKIGPDRIGPAWTEDRIQTIAWTEDRTGKNLDPTGPLLDWSWATAKRTLEG